jgi:uncharacterized protein YgbK (DUF1537 family)
MASRLSLYSRREQRNIVGRVICVLAALPANKRTTKDSHLFYTGKEIKQAAKLMKLPVSVVTDALLKIN